MLVQDGYLVPSALHRERVSPQEVVAEMRKAGLERIEEIKWGVLETDGKISIVPARVTAPHSDSTFDDH